MVCQNTKRPVQSKVEILVKAVKKKDSKAGPTYCPCQQARPKCQLGHEQTAGQMELLQSYLEH